MDEPVTRRSHAERRARSERKLLVATAGLIVERGLNNTSLVEIGRRAGVSHALVTHLFGTKATMIERLNEVVDDLYLTHVRVALDGKGGIEALLAFTETYLQLVTGDDPVGRVHLVLWAEAVAGTPDIRPSRAVWDRRFRDGVAALVTEAVRAGEPRIDPESAAFVIVGVLRGVALQLLVDTSSMSLDGAVAVVGEMVRGLLELPDRVG